MKSAFDKIAAGLEDAIAYAGGDTSRGGRATVDVKAIRAATKRLRRPLPPPIICQSARYGIGSRAAVRRTAAVPSCSR